MMRGLLILSLFFGSFGAAHIALAQDVALVNATVWDASGPARSGMTILVRGGEVRAVGDSVRVPDGVDRVDVAGSLVTPGFVGVATQIGLVEIGLENSTRDDAPDTGQVDPVRAAFSAADGFNPRSTLLPVARLGGVTSVMPTPRGGLVAGTSAWLDLRGRTPETQLVRRHVALHVDLDDGGIQSGGGAMPAALGRLREILEDAQLYGQQTRAYERRALRRLQVSRHDLGRLSAVLAGELPVVIQVARADNIRRALELGRTFGLRLILSGVQEGWMVAEEIARAEVPVIVQPQTNMPSRFSRLASRYDSPTILHRAGVRLIFSTYDAHGLHNLRQEAGNAVAMGVPRDVALRALTSEPARAFGLDNYGGLGAGQRANIVVWSGDPFELDTAPTHIFVGGHQMPLTSRQTELFQRYRDLSRVRRGYSGLPAPAQETSSE